MYDRLDQAGKDDIDAQSSANCVADFTNSYLNFKDASDALFTSSAYSRGKTYKAVYTYGTSTVTTTIKVWKQTSTDIYFIIKEVGSSTLNYFLRWSLTQNDEMIDDIFTDHCNNVYTQVSMGENGPLAFSYAYTKSDPPNTEYFVDSFNLSFPNFAFFANYKLSRTITTKDVNGTQIGSPVTSSSTLTAQADTIFTSDDYSDAALYTQKFCEVEEEVAGIYRISTTNIGFKITDIASCVATPPGTWDIVYTP